VRVERRGKISEQHQVISLFRISLLILVLSSSTYILECFSNVIKLYFWNVEWNYIDLYVSLQRLKSMQHWFTPSMNILFSLSLMFYNTLH
jgi:hypothetical protein